MQETLFLLSLHLQLLFRCFVNDNFRVVYEFSEKWIDVIQKLSTAHNFCVKLLSKSFACMFSHALLPDEHAVRNLDDLEVKLLCQHLSLPANEIVLPDFQVPLEVEEYLALLEYLCECDSNREHFLTEPSFLPALHKIISDETIKKTAPLMLFLELTKSPNFESAQSDIIFNYTASADLSVRVTSSMLLCQLQAKGLDTQLVIQDAFKMLLEGFFTESQGFLMRILCNLPSSSSECGSILRDTVLPALLEASSQSFEGTYNLCLHMFIYHFVLLDLVINGSIKSDLPAALYSILCCITKCKEAGHGINGHILSKGPVYQLKVLGTFKVLTWVRFYSRCIDTVRREMTL